VKGDQCTAKAVVHRIRDGHVFPQPLRDAAHLSHLGRSNTARRSIASSDALVRSDRSRTSLR
jgi:hypothetical protein